MRLINFDGCPINVYETEDGQFFTNGKDLHAALQIKEKYQDWINRSLNDLRAVQGMDFFRRIGKSTFGRPPVEIWLTNDMSQHIALMQRNDIGKRIREFYIKVKDMVFAQQKPQQPQEYNIPKSYADALLLAYNQAKEIEELKPKAEYTDKVLQSKSTWLTTIIAKELGMSAIKLNKTLNELGVQFKRDGVWVLTSKYQDKGYTDTKTHIYNDSSGNMCTSIETVWTEAGRKFIHDVIAKQKPNITFSDFSEEVNQTSL